MANDQSSQKPSGKAEATTPKKHEGQGIMEPPSANKKDVELPTL